MPIENDRWPVFLAGLILTGLALFWPVGADGADFLFGIKVWIVRVSLGALAFVLLASLFIGHTPLGISKAIDTVNREIGQFASWAIFLAVIVSAVNAIIRKVLNQSSNFWLELQWVLFGIVFLLCCSWTLMSNEHIRIDVVANHLSKKVRNWIDVIGHALFLAPFCLIMVYYGWPFFLRSFFQNEGSSNAGGMVQWVPKFFLPLGFTLLLFQSFSELAKRVAIMRGQMADATGGGHHEAAEAEAQRLRESLAEEAAERARIEAERAGKPS